MPQSNPPTRVALVGHCGFDSGSLRNLAQQAWPDATVDMVNRADDLDNYRDGSTLLLVNRALDGRFTAGTGVDLIRELAAGDDPPRLMLVSNYPDAQAAAVAAGAKPGFGKNELGRPDLVERLRRDVSA